jgi:hypothetical protein
VRLVVPARVTGAPRAARRSGRGSCAARGEDTGRQDSLGGACQVCCPPPAIVVPALATYRFPSLRDRCVCGSSCATHVLDSVATGPMSPRRLPFPRPERPARFAFSRRHRAQRRLLQGSESPKAASMYHICPAAKLGTPSGQVLGVVDDASTSVGVLEHRVSILSLSGHGIGPSVTNAGGRRGVQALVGPSTVRTSQPIDKDSGPASIPSYEGTSRTVPITAPSRSCCCRPSDELLRNQDRYLRACHLTLPLRCRLQETSVDASGVAPLRGGSRMPSGTSPAQVTSGSRRRHSYRSRAARDFPICPRSLRESWLVSLDQPAA